MFTDLISKTIDMINIELTPENMNESMDING